MVSLKKISQEHLSQTYEWMMDADLRRNFLYRKTITPQDHQNWFANYEKDSTQEIFAIYHENKYVGNVGLKNIDVVNNNAETWIYIGDTSMKGKGIGVQANENLCTMVRGRFHKLYAHIAEFNLSSTKMYQKSGFVLEGNFKDQLYYENCYHNLLRLAFYL